MNARSRRFTSATAAALCWVLLAAPVESRPKTDVVIVRNGDSITGEIQQLERGKLRIATSYMGTVEIRWDEVQSVKSSQPFEIQLVNGEHYSGSVEDIDLPAVAMLRPRITSVWSRFRGNADVGQSFTSANRTTHFNTSAQAVYQGGTHEISIDFTSIFDRQEDAANTDRRVLTVQAQFLRHRWLTLGLFQLQSSESQSLDSRILGGASFGRSWSRPAERRYPRLAVWPVSANALRIAINTKLARRCSWALLSTAFASAPQSSTFRRRVSFSAA